MANIKSAKKKIKSDKTKQEQNDRYRVSIKKGFKSLKKLGENEDRQQKISELVSVIDKSAKRKVIKKNKASRLKSKAYKLK
jgi:small subunit ribosomal protein S20